MAFAANGAKVHEDIIARVAGDEAEALGCVEPLHGTGITIAGILRSMLAGAGLARAAGEAHGQVHGHGQRRADQCGQVAHFRAGQQCQGLQHHRHYQQGAGQMLQLLPRAAVVQWHDRGQHQVEQAEQAQVHRVGLLQEG